MKIILYDIAINFEHSTLMYLIFNIFLQSVQGCLLKNNIIPTAAFEARIPLTLRNW